MKNETTSYKIGRFWGSLGWAARSAIALAVVGGIYGVSTYNAGQERQRVEQAAAVEKAAAARADAALESERQLVVKRCQTDVAELKSKAAGLSKSGDIDGAHTVMSECAGNLTDPDALKLATKYEADNVARVAAVVARQNAHLAASKKLEGVRIGMTPSDVYASSWGHPDSVNRTTTASGRMEQWVYGSGQYLYFENSVLTTIQD